MAQGLCQVRFLGEVDAYEEPGPVAVGHLVEVEIGALTTAGDEPRELVLHLHLARGTRGAELTEIVGDRLRRLGIGVVRTGGEDDPGSLWIERARYVRLRLGGGLSAVVACSEGPPTALRVLPPSAIESTATLTVSASTARVLRGRPPMRDVAALELSLAPELSAAEVASLLSEAAAKAWVGERPRGDDWRPHKMVDGAAITGVSVQVSSETQGGGDWRLEVEL